MPLVYRCLVLELGMHFNIVGIDINLLLTTTTLVVMKMTLSACHNRVTDIKPLWITNSFQDTATQSLVVLMHHTIEGTLYHPLPSTSRYPIPPATLYHPPPTTLYHPLPSTTHYPLPPTTLYHPLPSTTHYPLPPTTLYHPLPSLPPTTLYHPLPSTTHYPLPPATPKMATAACISLQATPPTNPYFHSARNLPLFCHLQ